MEASNSSKTINSCYDLIALQLLYAAVFAGGENTETLTSECNHCKLPRSNERRTHWQNKLTHLNVK